MGQAHPDEGFTVRDRRRQTDTEEAPETAREPTPAAPDAPEPSARVKSPRDRATRPPAERSLEGLVVMLASSALIALGEAPDPVRGERRPDLAQAAELIDVLLLLREKTEGNRTAEESRMFEDVIYDLQLRYVGATKRSG